MSYWIQKGIDGFYLSGIEYLARTKFGSVAVCVYISTLILHSGKIIADYSFYFSELSAFIDL